MHGKAVAQRALREFRGRFGPLGVITYVMTASSIGASRGGGYARYLEGKTVEPERGDYSRRFLHSSRWLTLTRCSSELFGRNRRYRSRAWRSG